MDEKLQTILKKLAEVIYDQYLIDLKAGNLKNGICRIKQAVGKSATKRKTFQQTAFDFK